MRSRINGFNFSAISTNFLLAGTKPFGSDHTFVPKIIYTYYSQCHSRVSPKYAESLSLSILHGLIKIVTRNVIVYIPNQQFSVTIKPSHKFLDILPELWPLLGNLTNTMRSICLEETYLGTSWFRILNPWI